MSYRAFIASTKQDLDKQRESVTKQLRDAGLIVDPMENWPADAENPATLSAKRAKGCHFCIALIAFQSGTVALNDPHGRAITQLEIDAATMAGAKVLYFLLQDTPENRNAWPKEFQREDEHFVAWRKRMQAETTCSFFDAQSMPDVLPSVARQIMQKEATKRRVLTWGFLLLIGAGIFSALGFAWSDKVRTWAQSRLLAINDPVIFDHSRSGGYNIARLLDGRADIVDNANFREEILGTRESFDLFANTFGSFREYLTEFDSVMKRGARLRIVITDFADENRSNWEAYNNATEPVPGISAETIANAQSIIGHIQNLKAKYPSQVDVRVSRKPMFYTLWVRDPKTSSGMAHLGVTYYGVKAMWPAFRVSQRTGGNQLSVLAEQFEMLWRDAKPVARE